MWRRDERGQALAIMALSITVLIAMVGVATDVGVAYAEKQKLQRAVDAASLAGIQDFPDISLGIATANQYVSVNEPGAASTATRIGTEKKLRVTANKNVPTYFLRVIGRTSFFVEATAVAGFDGELDVILNLDATGSMNLPPTKLSDAKLAANSFVDVLLPDYSGGTKIGLVPYNMCYNPPGTFPNCQAAGSVLGLTDNASTLQGAINAITARSGTNTCEGLLKAKNTILGAGSRPGPDTYRVVVLLADGDNEVNERNRAGWSAACDPGADMIPAEYGGCNASVSGASALEIDRQTLAVADGMKAFPGPDIEIYVVGFGVCGSANTNTCNRGLVGTAGSDSTLDRNLLKCIASSKAGGNDHYFEAASSSELDAIFRKIAAAIVTRLIE